MTPVIRHLQANFVELFLPSEQKASGWAFGEHVKTLGPDFYSKLIPLHPVLNLEYSVLCSQLRHNLSIPGLVSKEQLIEQLSAALMLAELSEHLHFYYLNVPREVVRLRRQQEVYRTLLAEMAGYSFNPTSKAAVNVGRTLSQQIREYTAWTNWYRLLATRGKRLLNLLDLVTRELSYFSYFKEFIALLDACTNPFFAYVAWCFFIPRLSTNLFLLAKHVIPGFWMSDEEMALGWSVRLEAQLLRRLFELVNDSVWLVVGLLNCYLLIGRLGPVSVYTNLFAFAVDVANTSYRAYLELGRLYKLQEDYSAMLEKEDNEDNIKAIIDYQNFIQQRINFEYKRLGLSIVNSLGVFFSMSVAMPLLAFPPVISFIGAVIIIGLWTANFVLTDIIEQQRPKDNVQLPPKVSTLSFFARKNEEQIVVSSCKESIPDNHTVPGCSEPTLRLGC